METRDIVTILPDYDEKIGNMKASVLAARDAESAGYAHYMAQALSASGAQREENKKLAEIRKQRHGIDPTAQAPSTLAILARDKKDDLRHFLRPLVDCQVKNEDGSVNISERPVTIEEISHIEATRRRPKNSAGQSEKSSADEERKEAAAHAYLCSPGTTLTPEELQRVTQVVAYEEPKPLPAPVKKPEKLGWDFQGLSTKWDNFWYKRRNPK